jgi:hypothetical protein
MCEAMVIMPPWTWHRTCAVAAAAGLSSRPMTATKASRSLIQGSIYRESDSLAQLQAAR